MRTLKQAKYIIGAVAAVTATTLATGSAFTAGGIDDTSGDGFVGGKMSQTVSGATVTNVAYGLGSGDDGNLIGTVVVTFDNGNADARIVGYKVRLVLRTGDATPVQKGVYSCTDVSASFVSTCSASGSNRASSQEVSELLMTVSET